MKKAWKEVRCAVAYAACTLLTVVSAPSATAAVTVPVMTMDGLPVVTVRMGAVKADFLLDTGGPAAITVPEPLIVPSAGVRTLPETTKTTDASGTVREIHKLVVREAVIGGASVGSLKGLVNYKWGLSLDSGQAPEVTKKGTIGIQAFAKGGVVFDLGRGWLTVIGPGEGVATDASWQTAPLTVDGRGAVVKMSSGGRDVDLVLDSAASVNVMKKEAGVLIGANNPCKGKRADAQMCGETTFKKASIGGKQLKPIRFTVLDMGPLPFDGLLGIDFFKRHEIYLDIEGSRMLYRAR